jgi:hypothetical protein
MPVGWLLDKAKDEIERLRALDAEALPGERERMVDRIAQRDAELATLRTEIERLRAALERVNQECDGLMVLADGETEDTLTGYGRGVFFTARQLKALAQEKPAPTRTLAEMRGVFEGYEKPDPFGRNEP